MHLGTTPWNFDGFSAAKLGRQAALAERLGYESFWIPENHFNAQAIPDPLMLLASCAASTQRIGLGTTSYLLTLRNALQAAEQVAVLDQLSEGRVILGVGRGYAPTMLAAFKVAVRDKRRIFEDCLNEMILAWSGATMRVGDAEASDSQVTLGPLPVQRPHPPLWIAAFGPKALTQAGRLGLPYLASPMETLTELQDNLAVYAQSYAATWSGNQQLANNQQAGQETIPVMRSVFVSDDATAVARVREHLSGARGGPAGNAPAPADAWALIGDRHEVADRVAQYREALGMTHLIASRPRVPGLQSDQLERSLASLRRICSH